MLETILRVVEVLIKSESKGKRVMAYRRGMGVEVKAPEYIRI
jgi:hypothetical protein